MKEESIKLQVKNETLKNKFKFKQTSEEIIQNGNTNKVQRKIVSALSEFNDKLNEFLSELLTDDLENK